MSQDSTRILYGHAEWPDNGQLMREFGERRWDVERVPRAAQVVEHATSQSPNVVLLDALIQGGGAAVPLEAMQTHPTLGRVPVVVINSEEEADDAYWLAHGASVCLPRNSSPQHVTEEIDKLLGNSVEKLAPRLRVMGEEERFHDAMGGRVFTLKDDQFLAAFAHLATRLLTAPMVLVTPVDERFQFFTSQQGFRDPASAEARSLRVPYSFPRWLIGADGAMVVPDIKADKLLGGSATIAESGLGAYACTTVAGSDGKAFALIFVADTRAHAWSAREQALLRELGQILAGYTAHVRLGFDRDLGKLPEHRLVAHALQSWGAGISSVGKLIWHADFRLSPDERRQLADYVQQMGRYAARSSDRWV